MKTAIDTKDLFTNLPDKLLSGKVIARRGRDRQELATEIFNLFFAKILLDIIENNVTFVLPLRLGRYGEWHVKSVTGEAFKEKYKKGKWKDVDYVLANFTGNEFKYTYKRPKGPPIDINGELHGWPKQRLRELTLQQKQYY